MIEVRAATMADEPRVRELLTELGYPPSGSIGQRLALWTAVPHRQLLLAESDHYAVGLVAMTLTPRLESDRWWAQVVALVVSSHAREQGVGRRLLAHAEALSEQAGCDLVIVNSARERAGAQDFYARAGHRDRCGDHAQFVRQLSNDN